MFAKFLLSAVFCVFLSQGDGTVAAFVLPDPDLLSAPQRSKCQIEANGLKEIVAIGSTTLGNKFSESKSLVDEAVKGCLSKESFAGCFNKQLPVILAKVKSIHAHFNEVSGAGDAQLNITRLTCHPEVHTELVRSRGVQNIEEDDDSILEDENQIPNHFSPKSVNDACKKSALELKESFSLIAEHIRLNIERTVICVYQNVMECESVGNSFDACFTRDLLRALHDQIQVLYSRTKRVIVDMGALLAVSSRDCATGNSR